MDTTSRLPVYQRDSLALRAATKDDLDSIVQIVHAGFPDDPEVHYRFPRRDEFPEDYLKWTRMEYEGYIEQVKNFVVHLVEARSGDSVGDGGRNPVAIAVWDAAVLTKAHGTDKGLDERRDANKEHCRAFTEAAGESFRKYFAKYEEKQIHLWLLVTHPDYRPLGAGAMLTEWGLYAARERG
ncbi:hypothetical protein M409DRAFT_20656 [Zasmidium cellare ATCC 36951]|uniref:N-acetyltransferase domain-containing protein n=1 Tax=Zasmidium cellare ATCC 36951 TaxID=1080233 RepID=A0A6A6CVA6_ZASCE|nr:uncharacterized protein M409DRAFT_20656 [Zasmidium cellare ATCC 36951]KAF2169436.1 hypothetical protein M409DRAFT_20656 [Zasmidium cellare ATCC 36951]